MAGLTQVWKNLRRPLPADASYAQELNELPRQLVFIMGCHRSGTSMLYHLLAYTGSCEYVSAYDVIKYNEIVRNRVEKREAGVKAELDAAIRVEKNRGLDNLPVGVDYPEEYRWILAPKPAVWFLSVRRRVEKLSFGPHITPKTLGRFLEICRKKQFLAGGDKPLVLKNPNDFYFNFLEIHRMFPTAKMIFIHRHPLHVLNSYIAGFGGSADARNTYAALIDPGYDAMFRSPIRRRLFQRLFRSEQLPRYVISGLAKSYEYYLEKIRLMPQDSYVSLRYEDLCLDPESYLLRIGKWLNIGMAPRIPAKFVEPRNLDILEAVRSAYVERVNDIRPYLESQNYADYPASGALKKEPARNLMAAGSSA
jgi:hypothetical protein